MLRTHESDEMSTMTDRLTERHDGSGFTFAHPAASSIETDPEPATLESVVITDAEQPVMIVAAVEESPLDTPRLQVPGMLGELMRKYEALGGYEQRWYGRLPVEGSDAAEAAEIVYGEGDPRQALLLAARIDGPRIVTLQVHFPPSTAEMNRPLALAILESLVVHAPTS
jgi:hypothetical protein